MLDIHQVAKAANMTTQNVYRLLSNNNFPKNDHPPKSTGRGSATAKYGYWDEATIQKWMEAHPVSPKSGKRKMTRKARKANGVYQNKQSVAKLAAPTKIVMGDVVNISNIEANHALAIVRDLFERQVVESSAVQNSSELGSLAAAALYMFGAMNRTLSK